MQADVNHFHEYCDHICFRVDPSARLAPREYSGRLCNTVVKEALVKGSKEMLDIFSEYTDVSLMVNLNKLTEWMIADNEEEFKKLLPSLTVELVSETIFVCIYQIYYIPC